MDIGRRGVRLNVRAKDAPLSSFGLIWDFAGVRPKVAKRGGVW